MSVRTVAFASAFAVVSFLLAAPATAQRNPSLTLQVSAVLHAPPAFTIVHEEVDSAMAMGSADGERASLRMRLASSSVVTVVDSSSTVSLTSGGKPVAVTYASGRHQGALPAGESAVVVRRSDAAGEAVRLIIANPAI